MNALRQRLRPRSLAAQIALLVAIALFVAQGINFALLLRERRSLRLEQVTGPVVARLIDASDPDPRDDRRGRVRRVATNPIDPRSPRVPVVERALDEALTEAGIAHGAIVTGLRPLSRDDHSVRRLPPRRVERFIRSGAQLQIAVAQPGHGWLVLNSLWLRDDSDLVWRLIGQTVILYVVVLAPLLLAGRRLSRPLSALTQAAERFGPSDSSEPLPARGPDDVAQLIAAFNALRLRVTAMLDEKDRMLGAIGHDLRTPLAALRVRIESVEDDTDRARMVETIAEMNRTLDDILSLARLGRPSEAITEVDCAALVDAVVEDFRDLGQPVSFVEAERLRMRMRPSLMRRALRNLIENAVKYAGAAEVSLEPGPQQVAITVADRGPGIPEERLGDVFEAFTRLETSRNRDTGGIGLGLALARTIVREAGGDISLANRAGGGLAATITLPRR
ncbi:HAMP domain-containing sensor histidine kinase [Sphingomonas sp. GC_Shp_1]|uniref:HAMP domain-containing sensor histidine kinase n=1 Tax=unclassified Sphingomonas TaxID=196159 RepID=UPI00226AE899